VAQPRSYFTDALPVVGRVVDSGHCTNVQILLRHVREAVLVSTGGRQDAWIVVRCLRLPP
jgi:hypothetical protein